MKIQNVKGGYDFLPKEQKVRNYINKVLKETFEEYGYNPIETPILCYYDMLSGKYDEDNDILKEIYKLSDQGNRKLGLRYDLTVPFAKFIALYKNELKLPFKRYEIAKVFRDGPVKLGRDREFTQCDVDVVGLSDQIIESELLCLYVKAFNRLGIEVIIKYNNRKLMKGLILECNIEENKISNVITIIDKIEKINREEIVNNLLNIGITMENIKKLLKLFSLSLEDINTTFFNTSNEEIKEGLQEINKLTQNITSLSLDNYCKFSSSLARGQDYYTGNVFEVYEKNNKLNCSIGGGGRYDNMITDFINDGITYPAVGISFGLTPIYELLKDKQLNNNLIDILIIPLNTEIQSLKIAEKIRDLGLKVDIEINNNKLRKSLEYASKNNIPYVIILGDDEFNNKTFNLKDMNNSIDIPIMFSKLNKLLDIIKK